MANKDVHNPQMKIGDRVISHSDPPFIIAELSANHNGSLDRALKIVEAAAKAGADALKIQTYSADTMTIDCDSKDYQINDPKSLWNGRTLYELYQEAHLPWDWHEPIFKHSKKLGMIPFSTPFDESAIEFLESLSVACYKVASFENTDTVLIENIARTGKPIIMSAGMASEEELQDAVNAARSAGGDHLSILKCCSSYPAPFEEMNISTIPDIEKRFAVVSGLSDHTLGTTVAVASVGLGACIIEKHFTLSRADGGVDSAFSLEPDEFATMVNDARNAWKALGEVRYGAQKEERRSLQFRRSIRASADIAKGDTLSLENIRRVRPAGGIAPKHFPEVLGRIAACDIKKGDAITHNLITDS